MEIEQVLLNSKNVDLKKSNPTIFKDDSADNNFKCNPVDVAKILADQKKVLEVPRLEKRYSLSLAHAIWDPELKLARVERVSKNLTKNFSHSRNGALYLYPEECLCLLEMRSLILTWNEKSLSIENAYAILLGPKSGCTFEQFRTYTYLVKLGFRVFKTDNELRNNSVIDPNDYLTRLPVIPYRKKEFIKDFLEKKKECLNLGSEMFFPKLVTGSSWLVLTRPLEKHLPYNVQPINDHYSFNICTSKTGTKITEVVTFRDRDEEHLKRKPPLKRENKVHQPQPTGAYPIYEKNMPETINSDNRNIDEPQVKRFKHMKTDEENLLSTSKTDFILNENYASTSNCKTDMINNICDESKNEQSCALNDIDTTSCMSTNIDEKTTFKSKKQKSGAIPEDVVIDMKLNLPSRIKNKLFAIKSTDISSESTKITDNIHHVAYDVYYPDNHVPKKERPPPNFRVIIFEHGKTFPNIYNVSVSNPNDNVPTLWAIVNASTVSFYNVNSIILPKATDWKSNHNIFC